VTLYRTGAEPLSDQARSTLALVDTITFTSASTVHFLLDAVGGPEGLPAGVRLASIGPKTTAELRHNGLEPDIEATEHDIGGLIDAVVRDAEA
jgi:uroporphyrinogen III methyltransferase/synthase